MLEPSGVATVFHRLQRWSLAGARRLLVVADPSLPVVVVCTHQLDGPRDVPATAVPGESLVEVARGGGRVVARRGGWRSIDHAGGVSSLCDTLPASELALAVWLLREQPAALTAQALARALGADVGEAADPLPRVGVDRLPRLALEQRAAGAAAGVAAQRTAGVAGPPTVGAPDGAAPRVHSLVGAFEPGALRALLAEQLGPVVDAGAASAAQLPLAPQSSERLSVLESERLPAPLTHYAWRVPGAPSAERAALELAAVVLAGGSRSRLSVDLVARRRLASAVGEWQAAAPSGALLGLSVLTAPRSSVDETSRFVDGALLQLRIVGPSEAELERARGWLLARYVDALAQPRARSELLARAELGWGDARTLSGYLDTLSRVDAAALRRAAATRLVTTQRCVVEVYPVGWPQDDPERAAYRFYTVQPGDTLAELARRHGVHERAIVRANDLDPRYRLPPGQALWLPPASGVAAPASGAAAPASGAATLPMRLPERAPRTSSGR